LASFILQTVPQLWSNAVHDLVLMFHQSDSTDLQVGLSTVCVVVASVRSYINRDFWHTHTHRTFYCSVLCCWTLNFILAVWLPCMGACETMGCHNSAFEKLDNCVNWLL